MEAQYTLFERPEKKGITQTAQHVAAFNECERLEALYKDHLHHCNRVKSQALLPNEINDTFQQQISSGMDTQIALGLLYCILTNDNPSCNYPWEYLKDLKIANKAIVTDALMKLVDDYILHITADALNQIFWFLDAVLKANYFLNNSNCFVTQIIISVMRHIDVNRVTRYSLNLSQTVMKFVINHLDWLEQLNKTNERIFIHQIIYLFLRLIENHDHSDLQQSRQEEVRFVARLFDKFPDSWTFIGRDFIRLFQHLYPIESFAEYWGLIDGDNNSSKLIQILDTPTNPLILQVCINKQEQRDLVQLCNDITNRSDVTNINNGIGQFVEKYLSRNKSAEHSCDVMRFVISCYNQNEQLGHGLPDFRGKQTFLFNLLFYFFARAWKNEVRSFIYEAMLQEVLYYRPSDKCRTLNKPTCASAEIIDRVLAEGSTRQPDITANLLILILETVRHYKTLHKGCPMRLYSHQSVVYFFQTAPQRSHLMMTRKDFVEKYQSLVNCFKREFDVLYKDQKPPLSRSNSAPTSSSSSPPKVHARVKWKLEFEENLGSSITIPSFKSLSISPNGSSNATSPKVSMIGTPDFKMDIERIKQFLNKYASNNVLKSTLCGAKLMDMSIVLMDYYSVKYIAIPTMKNDKSRRGLSSRLQEITKSVEKNVKQLLNAFGDDLERTKGNAKSALFDVFSKCLVDIFGIEYQHNFMTPDKLSPIWNVIFDWTAFTNSKQSKYHSNAASNDPDFKFDFVENRIWLLKFMCSYKEDELKYIVLLYDSKKKESKGFIKHLGVCQKVGTKHTNGVRNKLNGMHSWNKNQSVDGVKINVHTHGLLYGRRPFESIICDLCEKDWNGSSWHCKNGCDFDTCHECFCSYLERKQLYRAVLYLRGKHDNIKLKTKTKSKTVCSELFYEDIKQLQTKSSVLLSSIHQYLFYAYSCFIHPRAMDLIQIVLEVINPLQVQSLCKDIQLALFQLFDPSDIVHKLPKYIEISLLFPQYIQTSFWTLLNAFLRTRNNADDLFLRCLKYLAKLKRAYIQNGGDSIWITSTAMNGFLDWTQMIYRSKKMDEIYDLLLSFPTKSGYLNDDDEDVPIMNNAKSELSRSMSPSTTVFNASSSSFDEFHIQALVQLLSLKSPKWKSWLQTKLKFLKTKYLQKQEQHENDEFVSLNRAKRRNTSSTRHNMIDFNVCIDHFDEGYLLNLLKFYEYLTFVEPNINDNAVSVMANTFLFDADQRNILVGFFSQFSSLHHYLNELKEFWPGESSKSMTGTPKQTMLMNEGSHCPSSMSQGQHYKAKSAAERIEELGKINSPSSKSMRKYNTGNHDLSEISDSDDDVNEYKKSIKSKTVPKKKKKKIKLFTDGSDSSSSSISRKRKKENKHNRDHLSPARSSLQHPQSDLIPKRNSMTFSPSQMNTKRNRSSVDGSGSGNGRNSQQPPTKKRKLGSMTSSAGNMRRTVSSPVSAKKYVSHHANNQKKVLKRDSDFRRNKSPKKKRNSRQIDDSSDDDEAPNMRRNNVARSPSRSESSVSYEFDEDEEDDEDSLANRYSSPSTAKSTSLNTNDGTAESWF